MREYEVILFDLDDTLVDNLENVRYAYRKMVEYVGEQYTEKGFLKWYELDKQHWIDFRDGKIIVPESHQKPQELYVKYVRSLRHYNYFEGRIDMDLAFEINEIFLNSLNEVVIEVEGAYETLEYLSERYRLIVATNGPTTAVDSKLSKIDCRKFIDDVFSADMTKTTSTKPSTEYFDELKEYIKFYDTSKMLIVGDSLKYEIKGGMNNHIDSCWFNPNDEELPEEYEPTMIIKHLKELKNRL